MFTHNRWHEILAFMDSSAPPSTVRSRQRIEDLYWEVVEMVKHVAPQKRVSRLFHDRARRAVQDWIADHPNSSLVPDVREMITQPAEKVKPKKALKTRNFAARDLAKLITQPMLRQTELCREVGAPQASLNSFINGRRQSMPEDHYAGLARVADQLARKYTRDARAIAVRDPALSNYLIAQSHYLSHLADKLE